MNKHDAAIAEFLAKGGVIQQGAYRESGRVEGAVPANAWGAKKAGRPPASSEVDPAVDVDEDEDE